MIGKRIDYERRRFEFFPFSRARARVYVCARCALCRGASGRYVKAAVGIVIENGGKNGRENRREGERGENRERGSRESERGAHTLARNTPKCSDKSISGEKRSGKRGLWATLMQHRKQMKYNSHHPTP